jgi:hypothetical protein
LAIEEDLPNCFHPARHRRHIPFNEGRDTCQLTAKATPNGLKHGTRSARTGINVEKLPKIT